MLLYYHSWMFYNHFIATLYHFLGLTYWTSAQCQLLFFACFLHCRKSISNGVQMPQNSTMIFYGPKERQWALVAPGGCPEGGTIHQGAPEINIRRRQNTTKLYGDLFWTRRNIMGPGCTWGCLEEGTTHQGAPGGLGAPWWVVPTSGAPRTTSLLYKYPKKYQNPRGVDEIFIQPPQSPEPPDPIWTPSRMGFTTSIGASPMMRE